jgi:hypothetical protein
MWPARARGLAAPKTGAITFVQRFGVTTFVTDQRLARSLLAALSQTAEPAAFAPARDPPQAELAWDEPA